MNQRRKPLLRFLTDLRATWEYLSLYVYPKAPKNEAVTHLPFTPNHFRLTPSPLPWMDLPYGQQPDWLTSRKPDSEGQPQGNSDWARRPTMAFACRTAVLVRGNRSSTISSTMTNSAPPPGV